MDNLTIHTYTYFFPIYIHSYTRTHMNALARASVDGIHDRFAQSLYSYAYVCVYVYIYASSWCATSMYTI